MVNTRSMVVSVGSARPRGVKRRASSGLDRGYSRASPPGNRRQTYHQSPVQTPRSIFSEREQLLRSNGRALDFMDVDTGDSGGGLSSIPYASGLDPLGSRHASRADIVRGAVSALGRAGLLQGHLVFRIVCNGS